ncbi:hypothetical protein EVAR_53655_1 [Eumeta japonica]|uniref:Uncharacterized protein n=1 Tax=Eumeta variegata TaxID=151549 RepID=A0A4C1YP03_EUMVA|nr:hypothetical protein EVAR_53655_1 [Eumeta japonica]
MTEEERVSVRKRETAPLSTIQIRNVEPAEDEQPGLRDARLRAHEIDDVICAAIPRTDVDKDLHTVVTKNMIYGPCGELNKISPCMVNGKCSEQYHRACKANTLTGDNGYFRYRRLSTEDGGNSATIHM